METCQFLVITTAQNGAEDLAELRRETGGTWVIVEAARRPGLASWPPQRAMMPARDFDAVLIQVPDPCDDLDCADAVTALARHHDSAPVYLLATSFDPVLARKALQAGVRGVLVPRATGAFFAARQLREGLTATAAVVSESRGDFRTLVESLGEAMLVYDEKRRLLYANPAAEALVAGGCGAALADLAAALVPGAPPRELPTVGAAGQIWLQGSMSVVPWSGRPALALAVRDVTADHRLHEDLRISRTFANQVVANASEGILVVDRDHVVRLWNPAMEELTGVPAGDAVGEDARSVFPALAHREIANAFQRALWGDADQTVDLHFCMRRTNRTGWISASFSPDRDARGDVIGVVALIHDVTRRKEAENEIRHLAYHDPLTGLPNRRLFHDRLEQSLANATRYGRPFAVLVLDLDHFKEVNDSLGHNGGDRLLRLAVQRLRANLRAGDTIARMGGDEFVILLPSAADEAAVAPVAAKLIDAFSEPFVLERRALGVTASIGYALYPDDGATSLDLIKHADQAMYAAKEAGRNRCRRFHAQAHRAAE